MDDEKDRYQSNRLQIRMDSDTLHALDTMRERYGMTRAAYIRLLIREDLERRLYKQVTAVRGGDTTTPPHGDH